MSDTTDVSKLTFMKLALLMNSCDYGQLATVNDIKELCVAGGLKVTDGKHVHLIKFMGFLLEGKHHGADLIPGMGEIVERHKAKKALPDRRSVPNLTWREAISKPTKFDDEAKGVFLQHYAMTKRKKHSAMMAGVCSATVDQAMKDDGDFKKAVAEMAEYYKDHIHEMASDQFAGIPEVIFGGKNRDKVKGYKLVFPNNNMLSMELKRTNPEYNEKHDIDMNVSGGVLVAPAVMSMDDYIKNNVKSISDGVESEELDDQG